VRRESGAKTPVSLSGLEAAVATTLDDTQRALFAEAAERRKAGTTEVTTLAEAEEAARTGFAVVPLAALGDEGEATLNAAGVSIRLLMRPDGSLPGAEGDGSDDDLVAVVARAY